MSEANGTTAVQEQRRTVLDKVRAKVVSSRGEHEKALQRHGIDPLYFERVVLTELRKNPTLLECEPLSLFQSIMEAAQLGLVPDSSAGHAYLIPYYNSHEKRLECQLMPGYRGFIALAYRGGHVSKMVARAVREGEPFEVSYGTEEGINHTPRFDESAPITHVYAIAWQKEGDPPVFVVLPRARIDEIRERAKQRNRGKDSPAWLLEFEAMALKTAVRSLFRWVRVEPEAQAAASRDERFDMDPSYSGAREVDAEDVSASERRATPTDLDDLMADGADRTEDATDETSAPPDDGARAGSSSGEAPD